MRLFAHVVYSFTFIAATTNISLGPSPSFRFSSPSCCLMFVPFFFLFFIEFLIAFKPFHAFVLTKDQHHSLNFTNHLNLPTQTVSPLFFLLFWCWVSLITISLFVDIVQPFQIVPTPILDLRRQLDLRPQTIFFLLMLSDMNCFL